MTALVSDSDTRTIVREFVSAVWTGEDVDALDRLTTPSFELHQLVANEDHDREGFRAFQGQLLAAMPDFTMRIEDLVVEGDDAVALLTMGGTPQKPMQALKPTGKSFSVSAFHKYHLEDGRIAEVWVMADAMGTLNQLGLFPPPPRMILRIMADTLRRRLVGQ